MTGRRPIVVTLVALLALGAGAASAAAASGPGGASPDVIALPGAPEIVVRIGNPVVQASGNGIALRARATALLRGRVQLSGTAPAQAGERVRIERRDAKRGWVSIASAAVGADGRFKATWRPNRVGGLRLRAVAGTAAAGSATKADPAFDATAPQLDVTVYRPGVASWYGPIGRNAWTACGNALTDETLGVAHRTLPCGTPVAFYYRGRTLVVPVIDRGPFLASRTWDLTEAAFMALGGGGAGVITLGALPLAPAQPARR